ncbi:MAG: hypothetical protein ACU843_10975, partial [Gammaproteobacteria bacterium]
RNIAVALGNSPRHEKIVGALKARLDHPSELVREHSRWALERQDSLRTSGTPVATGAEGPIQNSAFSSSRSRP